MDLFDELMAVAGKGADVFTEGQKTIDSGEYRIMVGDFKGMKSKTFTGVNFVLKAFILASGDGSPTPFESRSFDIWLSVKHPKDDPEGRSSAAAHDRAKALGLKIPDDFRDIANGKLGHIVTARVMLGAKAGTDGTVRYDITKVLEIVACEPQADDITDSLEAY